MNNCQICGAEFELKDSNKVTINEEFSALLCDTCSNHHETPNEINLNHWRCLNDSIWSESSAVKILSYRILCKIEGETWPQELLDMIYLSDEELILAKEGLESDENALIHKDSNGVKLENGDSVVAIKDLNVKGSSMVVKRGTAVRNIKLVYDNAEQLEGKVNGQHIVILTKYVKK